MEYLWELQEAATLGPVTVNLGNTDFKGSVRFMLGKASKRHNCKHKKEITVNRRNHLTVRMTRGEARVLGSSRHGEPAGHNIF
jgi:hypothetical protein